MKRLLLCVMMILAVMLIYADDIPEVREHFFKQFDQLGYGVFGAWEIGVKQARSDVESYTVFVAGSPSFLEISTRYSYLLYYGVEKGFISMEVCKADKTIEEALTRMMRRTMEKNSH